MIFLLITYITLGIIVIYITVDMEKQLKDYEQQQKEHRETIPQTTPAAKKNNKMDQKRSSGKSKGSRSKGKKDIKYNKS